MRRHIWLIALTIALAAFGLTGCFDTLTQPERDNELDPTGPGGPDIPAMPGSLRATVSDRLVSLTWTVSDTTDIGAYVVYRWEVEDEEDEQFEQIETVEESTYDDADVLNGLVYEYRIASVTRSGLEGDASPPVRVVPSIFSIAINQGAEHTATRSVSISTSASAGTELMQFSENADMSGASWIPYSTTGNWQLSEGDGAKTVYARFRDATDSESSIVSDSITLDTWAVISSVTEDSGGETLAPGDVLHLTIDAGETGGEATVEIEDVAPLIELYDDGTAGDAVAEDGVYERDYEIEPGAETVDATVTGYFADALGNEAEPMTAPGTVTILVGPEPVTLQAPVVLGERRIALSWSRSLIEDFGAYLLYRSYVPGVDTSTDRELIAELTTAGSTSFTDGGLEPDSTYYYAVYVSDDFGQQAVSNEVSATTLPNEPPDPVELYAPWADTTSVELSWSRSDAEDFLEYEVITWEQVPPAPPDPDTKRVLSRIADIAQTFYTHTSVEPTVVYWYQIAVVDSFGARALSDSVSASVTP